MSRFTEEWYVQHQAKQGKDAFQQIIDRNGFNPHEEVDHMAVARYLDILGLLYIHVPSEGKRKKSTGGKLKAMGAPKGFPDFQIFDAPPLNPCAKGVCLELKRQKGGKITDDQRQWIEALRQRGWIAEISEGANAAIAWLQSLGWYIDKRNAGVQSG